MGKYRSMIAKHDPGGSVQCRGENIPSTKMAPDASFGGWSDSPSLAAAAPGWTHVPAHRHPHGSISLLSRTTQGGGLSRALVAPLPWGHGAEEDSALSFEMRSFSADMLNFESSCLQSPQRQVQPHRRGRGASGKWAAHSSILSFSSMFQRHALPLPPRGDTASFMRAAGETRAPPENDSTAGSATHRRSRAKAEFIFGPAMIFPYDRLFAKLLS